jgi:hypothetical protein
MSIPDEFVVKQDIRNNPVVRDLDPHQRRDFRRTLLLAAAVVAMLLFSGWQQVTVMNLGFAIDDLRRRESDERAVQRRILLEREMRRSLRQIEARAMRELGLTIPADTLVIERVKTATPAAGVIAAR